MTARPVRGWGGALALALFAVVFSLQSVLLIAVPLAMLLIALAPARSPYRLLAMIVLALLFAMKPTDPLWYADRGWALLLGGAFVATVAVWPRGGYIGRGLVSVGVAGALAGTIVWLTGAWDRMAFSLTTQVRRATNVLAQQIAATPEARATEMADTFRHAVDVSMLLYPALLALASLASLAVAWWVYRRLVEHTPQALAPLREFRFTDHLVWVLVLGAALLVLPVGELAERVGANLATFMAALYVLRGAAVVVALTTPGVFATVVMVVMAAILAPYMASAALVVGLSDTWLDLRSRVRAEGESGT